MIATLLTNAGYVLAVQLLALLSLGAADFGSFSLLYLAFALGSSLMLSIVSEAWVRRQVDGRPAAAWGDYARAALEVSVATGALAAILALAVPSLRDVAAVGASAVTLATFRTGARYYDARVGRAPGVAPGDALGLGVTIGGAVLLLTGALPVSLEAVVVIWAAGCAASLLATRPFVPVSGGAPRWCRDHRREITTLLRDSLVLDAGSIGTPLLLAPLLGLAGFGVYRAVSNVAAPVRLVLNPLRPIIADRGRPAAIGRRRLFLVATAATVFGMLAAAALLGIGVFRLEVGALSDLAPYALPTGLFVAANFLGHYSYIVCRAHSSGSVLLRGRILQTVSSVVLPLAGVVFAGLPGAIWGYALCTTASSLYWMMLASGRRK